MILLPSLAYAEKDKIDTLYHNTCLYLVLGFLFIPTVMIHMIRDVDVSSHLIRVFLLGFSLFFSFIFSTQFFFTKRKELFEYPQLRSYYFWKLANPLVFSVICGSYFLDITPETPTQIFLFKYLLAPFVLPHAFTSAVFYLWIFIFSSFNMKRRG